MRDLISHTRRHCRTPCNPVGRVFIAPESELPGEDWPTRLTTTIRETWVTLVVISRHACRALSAGRDTTRCEGGPGGFSHRDTDTPGVVWRNATAAYRAQVQELSRPSFGIASRDRLDHRQVARCQGRHPISCWTGMANQPRGHPLTAHPRRPARRSAGKNQDLRAERASAPSHSRGNPRSSC